MLSIGLLRLYINITVTILDIIHRPVFYLKLNSTLYSTSQETHYVSATIPTGSCYLYVCDDGILIKQSQSWTLSVIQIGRWIMSRTVIDINSTVVRHIYCFRHNSLVLRFFWSLNVDVSGVSQSKTRSVGSSAIPVPLT
jgi:hypothetical protein